MFGERRTITISRDQRSQQKLCLLFRNIAHLINSFRITSSKRSVKLCTMHNPDFVPTATRTITTTAAASFIDARQNFSATPANLATLHIEFSELQRMSGEHHRPLPDLMRERTQRKEFFYGIEIVARSNAGVPSFVLNYNDFGALLMPLFTSLVWLGEDYAHVDRLEDVESVRTAAALKPRVITVPHFSCFRADRKRVEDFARLNFTNMLAIRGNDVDPEQPMKYASDLVEEMRRLRGDTISIGVAGYPEGHVEANSLEEDMEFLLKKVGAGADFIITQICFSTKTLIEFLRKCRSNGVTIPIVVGVFVPYSLRSLQQMCRIADVRVPDADMMVYKSLARRNSSEFQAHAERQAVELINEVLDSNLDVYGVQFYTINKFKHVQRVTEEVLMRKRQKGYNK